MIPSIGSPALAACLDGVGALDPAPDRVIVVLSGGAATPDETHTFDLLTTPRRLGFAAAANLGIRQVIDDSDRIAVLNDDAVPPPNWLDVLGLALGEIPTVAAVQGTITERGGARVDGRGIALDRWMLPVQLDRGAPASPENRERRSLLAVSGTAALFRTAALVEVSTGSATPFDPTFGSYHEDVDLGLRLRRLGWGASWVGGAPARHLGSESGSRLRWRHPWWLLANRWRAYAGNLTAGALFRIVPQLLRGELRAVLTLARSNPRTIPVAAAVAAAWPVLVLQGWRRPTPGPRLTALSDTA